MAKFTKRLSYFQSFQKVKIRLSITEVNISKIAEKALEAADNHAKSTKFFDILADKANILNIGKRAEDTTEYLKLFDRLGAAVSEELNLRIAQNFNNRQRAHQ
ncbi:hypothetical protein AQULUS_04180 [Aquicella lusitana]|uniref:hypothetical protein n=1 Tax=Aquicella lusitana TaxID=254246 RepID=UPI0011BD24D4|nr:hypothetical protein [Aquicella lusitana]VVC72698.1 hypothetical protein AQULUS_04180 [Aquicella lusitana]